MASMDPNNPVKRIFSANPEGKRKVVVVVVVGFYDALYHLRPLASLSTFSIECPTNFAPRL